ncbi:Beta-1,3-galactosyltransferase 1 [Bulinus truncatus]|nr:Beta-1,3-galactosyltransferase 1 [Bulinus truncatus]
MLMADDMLRVRPEDQRAQQDILESLKENEFEKSALGDGSRALDNTGVHVDNFQKYGGVHLNPSGKENVVATFGREGQLIQSGLLRNSDDISVLKQPGQIQKIGLSPILPTVVYGGYQSSPSEKSGQGLVKTAQDSLPQAGGIYQDVQSVTSDTDGEPLFADGLDERIKKFKFEYFGRYINESHTTGGVVIPYIIINPNRCGFPEKIDILYLINSIPSNSEQRQKIRDTFVASKFFPPHVISYVFLVGATAMSNLQTNLKHESLMYGDIVQGDFRDMPGNSSLKGLMGMRWVTEHCSQAEFVMKIDDEVFVDSDKLLNGLLPAVKTAVGKRAILCAFNSQGPIPRVGLNSFAPNMFPNRTLLRPYCKGYAVIMTRPVISSLVAAAKFLPLLHVEDFYLYGVLPFVAGGVEVYDLGNKRAFHDFGIETVKCYENMGDKCPFVASKAFRDRFTSLWQSMRVRMSKSGGKWDNRLSLWHIPNYKRNF